MNRTQRRLVVSPRRIQCVYRGMAKGAKQCSTVKKIKPEALAIVELCKPEGIRLVSQ